jgi:hypothetical protein
MHRPTRKDSELAHVVAEAVALADKVAEFYKKYHILEYEDRTELIARLNTTRQVWADCGRIQQTHIDLVAAITTNLRAHFEGWLEDELVARKRWLKHPGHSLNRLISKAETTTVLMQEMVLQESRKLSAVDAGKTALS